MNELIDLMSKSELLAIADSIDKARKEHRKAKKIFDRLRDQYRPQTEIDAAHAIYYAALQNLTKIARPDGVWLSSDELKRLAQDGRK